MLLPAISGAPAARENAWSASTRIDEGAWPATGTMGISGAAINHYHTARNTRNLALTCDDLRRLGDRKSTRLNSSHPSISYAVFCLKKKKKKKKQNKKKTNIIK